MTLAVLYTMALLAGGGIVLLLLSRWLAPRWVGLAALSVGLLALLPLLWPRGPLDISLGGWITGDGWTLTFAYRFDALARAMALIAAIPALLLLLWMGAGAPREEGHFAPWILLLTALFLHLVSSADLLWAYLGWEALLLASYFALTFRRTRLPTPGIAEWFLAGQHLAGLPLLFALLLIGWPTGTWHYVHLVPGSVSPLILGLLLGTAWIRMAQVPFQGWALAAAESPGPVSTLLLGSWGLLVGPYLWLRCLPLLSNPAPQEVALIAGTVSLVLGSVLALRQESGRRVQAGDTIARLGLVWIALGLASPLGIVAALYLMLDLSLSKVAFHLALFAGPGPPLPVRQGLYVVGTWSALGLPPTLGFAGRWLLIAGLVQSSRAVYLPWLLLAIALTLAYCWRGWALLPTGTAAGSRLARVVQSTLAAAAALAALGGLTATWMWQEIGRWALFGAASNQPWSVGTGQVESILGALAPWLPAWTMLLLAVGGLGAWWSGLLRPRPKGAADLAVGPSRGPLQEPLAVLPQETSWLAWIGQPAPVSRLFGRWTSLLGSILHQLVSFLERHTSYFLLVVLVAAAVVLILLTR